MKTMVAWSLFWKLVIKSNYVMLQREVFYELEVFEKEKKKQKEEKQSKEKNYILHKVVQSLL